MRKKKCFSGPAFFPHLDSTSLSFMPHHHHDGYYYFTQKINAIITELEKKRSTVKKILTHFNCSNSNIFSQVYVS